MNELSYDAGLAAGALGERERLRQVALVYLRGRSASEKEKGMMERLFGPRWHE